MRRAKVVVEGMGCKALRVTDPGKIEAALVQAKAMAQERADAAAQTVMETPCPSSLPT